MISLFPETRDDANTPEPAGLQGEVVDRAGPGINAGVWVFLSFAAVTLISTAIKGFIPLDLIEAAFWAGLAWICYQRKTLSHGINILIGILVILVAAGEGYSIGRRQASYTYLQEGNTQFRIDSRSGRTDRLWSNGWKPVTFDRPMDKINVIDGIFLIPLTNGRWEGQRICFNVQNKSDYIIKSIAISVTVTPKSPAATPTKLSVLMRPEVYGLLDSGDDDRFCGTADTFPGDAEWSSSVDEFSGWKR